MASTTTIKARIVVDERGNPVRSVTGETLLQTGDGTLKWFNLLNLGTSPSTELNTKPTVMTATEPRPPALPASESSNSSKSNESTGAVEAESAIGAINSSENEKNKPVTSTGESTKTTKWTDAESRRIITMYSENRALFESSTSKNQVVWRKISESFPNKTVEQIRNRWKYLKLKYTAVKDNRSSHSTGKRRLECKYFEEIDQLFGKDPNIVPPIVSDSDNAIATFPAGPQSTMGDFDNDVNGLREQLLDDPLAEVSNGSANTGSGSANSNSGPDRKKKIRKNRDDELLDELKAKRLVSEKIQSEKLEVQKEGVAALNRLTTILESYLSNKM